MAVYNESDPRFGQSDEPSWFDQNPPPSAPTYVTYDFLGYDGQTDVYRGSDGNLYQGDKNGPNGFSRYTGSATTFSPSPVAAPTPTQTPNTPAPAPGPSPTPLGVPTTGFGAAPAPYVSNAEAPAYTPLPTYAPPLWTGGDYVNPTVEELYASPGYQARLDDRLKGEARRYAAQGTILNGGTLRALDRSAQDYATNEYQTLRNNTYDAYVQKYKQFTDAAGMDLAARTLNANENNNTYANRTANYLQGNARTLSDFLTNYTTKRNSELDFWQRLQDLNSTGASLAGGSR